MHESISGVKKNLKGLVNVISIRCIGHFCYSKPSQLGAGCRRGYIHGRYSHSGVQHPENFADFLYVWSPTTMMMMIRCTIPISVASQKRRQGRVKRHLGPKVKIWISKCEAGAPLFGKGKKPEAERRAKSILSSEDCPLEVKGPLYGRAKTSC